MLTTLPWHPIQIDFLWRKYGNQFFISYIVIISVFLSDFCSGTQFLHSFWHIIWKHKLIHGKNFLAYFLAWHSIWHLSWHVFWHPFWHSAWHRFSHSFRHSIWHLFWHSIWHFWPMFSHSISPVFTFYLAYILTSCLTFYLAFSLAFALAFAWIQACLYNYASPLSDCRKVPLLVLRCSGAASRNIAPEQYAPSPAPAATPPCCSSQTLPPAPNLVVISIIMLWLGTGGLPHFRGRASALQSK